MGFPIFSMFSYWQRIAFTRGERTPNKAPLSSEWKHDSFLFLFAVFSHAKWNTDFCVSAVLLYWRNSETIMHRTSLCMLNPKKCASFHLLVSVVYRWIWEPDLSPPLHPSSPLGLARLGSALLSLHGQKMLCKKCYTKNVIQKCCSWRVGCKKCYACMSILTRYMHVSMAYHGHWAHRRCICHGTLSASSLHKHAWIIKRIVATCMSMLCTCRICCSRPRDD